MMENERQAEPSPDQMNPPTEAHMAIGSSALFDKRLAQMIVGPAINNGVLVILKRDDLQLSCVLNTAEVMMISDGMKEMVTGTRLLVESAPDSVGSTDLVRQTITQTDQSPHESVEELLSKAGVRISGRASSLPCTVPVQISGQVLLEAAKHLKKGLGLLWTSFRWLAWSLKTHAIAFWFYRLKLPVFGRSRELEAYNYTTWPNAKVGHRSGSE